MKTRQLTAMMACCGIVLLHTLAGQAKDMVGENENRTARQMPSVAGEETAYQYKIVKSLDDIVAGDGYLITYDAKSYVMGPIGSNHYGTVLTATFDKVNGLCTTTSDRNDLTIEINDDGYLLLKNSDGYIRHSSTDHQLATADEPATRAFEWKAESVSAYGNIKISNRAKDSWMLCFSSNKFGVYASGGGIQLYRRTDNSAGISMPPPATTDTLRGSAVYNMQGVRMNVGNLLKGIYIRNGRKVIVR